MLAVFSHELVYIHWVSTPNPKTISLAKGTAVTSVLTLLSRILGFVRDLIIARVFGSSSLTDCFFVAFRIPNLLRSLVAEGALSAAFVPVFADSLKDGRANARETIRIVSAFLLTVTIILSALGIIFAPQIISAFAPGFKADQHLVSLCIELTRYMMPLIIFVSLVAMLNGALNSLGKFGAAAWAQVWMNLTLIVGAILAIYQPAEAGIKTLAISALLGSVVQVLVQLPTLRKLELSIVPKFRLFNRQIGTLVKLMLPAIVGATVYQLGIFLNTVLASFLDEGSVSALYYADRLIQFPIGTFSIALGSVLLPALAISHSNKDAEGFSKQLFDSLKFTNFFIIPVATLIYFLALPLTQFVFERGSFNADNTKLTASAVSMYAIGLWAVSSHTLFVRTFLARKDTVTTTLTGIATLLVNFILALLFIGNLNANSEIGGLLVRLQLFLTNLFPSYNLGASGLALASAISSIFSLILVAVLALKHVKGGWFSYLLSTLKNLMVALLIGPTLALFEYQKSLLDFSLSLLAVFFVFCLSHYTLRTAEYMLIRNKLLKIRS